MTFSKSPVRGMAAAVVLGLAAAVHSATAQRTIVVSPAGAVRSIGAAVRVAEPGTRIIVTAGTYREPMIVVDKSVEIIGEAWPTLDGEGQRQIMAISANGVTVRGLHFRNVGISHVEDRAAIKVVGARDCVIEDNRIDDALFGIYLAEVTSCRLAGNVIRAHAAREATSGNGIHLWSSRAITITGNRITGHRDGIYFEFVHDSRITRNLSEGNLRYGLHFMYSDDCVYEDNTFRRNGAGVAVMYTKRVQMLGNRFEDNRGSAAYGLLLKEIYDSRIEGNRFSRNTIGLLADGATRMVAARNDFTGNGWALKLDASSEDALVLANNFSGNTFDVATNSRESSATIRGNYFDEYSGYDLDRDGTGDVPHRPVRLFSILVARNEPSLILLRSLFVRVLDAAERAIPMLTPTVLTDQRPSIRRIS